MLLVLYIYNTHFDSTRAFQLSDSWWWINKRIGLPWRVLYLVLVYFFPKTSKRWITLWPLVDMKRHKISDSFTEPYAQCIFFHFKFKKVKNFGNSCWFLKSLNSKFRAWPQATKRTWNYNNICQSTTKYIKVH